MGSVLAQLVDVGYAVGVVFGQTSVLRAHKVHDLQAQVDGAIASSGVLLGGDVELHRNVAVAHANLGGSGIAAGARRESPERVVRRRARAGIVVKPALRRGEVRGAHVGDDERAAVEERRGIATVVGGR